jgi:hypothetical protein
MRLIDRLVLILTLAGVASACTVGVFAPSATTLGRPILWKNRDVDNDNQEAAWRQGPVFAYVTDVYGSEDTSGAWAGINEAGFAIMNSNSYNLSGFRDDADDGEIMTQALGTCATVDDVVRILDSTNIIGRTTPANFCCFDSTGRAVIFEASNTFYSKVEVNDDSLGFQLRANYSMSGDTIRLRGKSRYDRAMQIVLPARRQNRIDTRFLIDTLCRDMGQTFFNPYPLPFSDSLPGYQYGSIPADSTICRRTTRSMELMIGPRPGEPASRGMMWILLGAPEAALPIPLWVRGGEVPGAMNGNRSSIICDEAIGVRDFLRSDPSHPTAVNTFRLCAVRSGLAAVESTLLAMVADSEAVWPDGPSAGQAYSLTATACDAVLQGYTDLWDEINSHHWGSGLPGAAGQAKHEPNISRETVRVTVPGTNWHGPVSIFNALGRRVAYFPYRQSGSVLSWTPGGLGSGSYFVVFPAAAQLPPTRITYIR